MGENPSKEKPYKLNVPYIKEYNRPLAQTFGPSEFNKT